MTDSVKKAPAKALSILEEAVATVKDREPKYGSPAPSFEDIAEAFTAITGKPIESSDVVIIMLLIKLRREAQKPNRDNRVDIAGYAYVLDKVMGG